MPVSTTNAFPDEAAFFAVGGPRFHTRIVTSANGNEQRNAVGGPHARREFTISSGVMAAWQAQGVVDFWNLRRGNYESFAFLDPFDYYVPVEASAYNHIGGLQFQLCKNYPYGTYTYKRPIVLPIVGSVNFVGGSGLSLDYSTGILTASSLPSAWSAQFRIQARFEDDSMQVVDKGGDQRTFSLKVKEVFDTRWTPYLLPILPDYIGVGTISNDAIHIDTEADYKHMTWMVSGNDIQEERMNRMVSPRAISNVSFLYSSYDTLQSAIIAFLCARGRRAAWWHDLLGICRFADDVLTIERIHFDSYLAKTRVYRQI